MERLRTLAIVVCLGAASQAASEAFADDPSPTAPAQVPANPPRVRPEPPAAPRKYLETGALLFNRKRYDLAAKYLEAAQLYRDRLTPNEQVVLDEFRDHLDRFFQDRKRSREALAGGAEVRVADPAVVTASTIGPPALDMSGKDSALAPAATTPGPPAAPGGDPALKPTSTVGTETLRGTADVKQNARWLLHQAREQIVRRQFDAAEKFVSEARAMDVKWGYFDDSPEKVTESIAKVRAELGSGAIAESSPPHDRRTARARFREARAALAANDLDKADAIAREVRSWDIRYGLFDDTPDKVAAAVGQVRRRMAARNAEMMVRSYAESVPGPRVAPTAPASPSTVAPAGP